MEALLETTAISDLLQQEPNTVARVNALSPEDAVAASVVSYGEIWFGLSVMPSGRRRRERQRRAQDLFARLPLEPVTRTVAEAYVSIRTALQLKGQMIPEADLWIAATASAGGYILVTRDTHFSYVEGVEGLTVEDWSKPLLP